MRPSDQKLEKEKTFSEAHAADLGFLGLGWKDQGLEACSERWLQRLRPVFLFNLKIATPNDFYGFLNKVS